MKENFITLCFLCNPHLSLSFIISLKLYALWDEDPDHSSSHWAEDNWTIMILPLLISPIALNLVQAKHSLVETEDNKDEDNKDKDNKANTIQNVQSSSYIFITHPDKFDILWNQGYTKSSIKFALVENLATRWRHLYKL